MKRKYRVAMSYVSARPAFTAWLVAFCGAVGRLFAPQVRTPPAPPQRVTAPVVPFYPGGVPDHVWAIRQRGDEAKWLLSRYTLGVPVSRRQCVAANMPESVWRRARRVLKRAGVIDIRGQLLYRPRDATLRLHVYLDRIEQMARESDRYIAP